MTTFWVKAYDEYNRPSNRKFFDRDQAFADFWAKKSADHIYVQMGAWTSEGSIVLNEWRLPANAS